MARLPRFVLSGHPQHVIQRGNNRSVIFVADARTTGFIWKPWRIVREDRISISSDDCASGAGDVGMVRISRLCYYAVLGN